MRRALLVALFLAAGCGRAAGGTPPTSTTAAVTTVAPTTTVAATTTTAPTTTTTAPPTTTTSSTLVPADGLTAAQRTLRPVGVIHGAISPKSVVATGDGLVFAQNMMYRHTITVYDRRLQLVKTIPDAIEPSAFGYDGYQGVYRGAPVEAAVAPDGRSVYVSNYEIYGTGYAGGAGDGCASGVWPDSFVSRVDIATLAIDQVIRVGAVPKFLAVTPGGRILLVANWCSYDVSVVDTVSGREVARIPVGRHPRGIAITSDSATAYVAVMGSWRVAVIDLASRTVAGHITVGANPRHLVLSPDGRFLYVTLNGEGRVAKVDLASGKVVAKVATGRAPRSMAISDDGTALYVVDYLSAAMSKVDTATMKVLQVVPTDEHPIGITYDAPTRRVWVSCYSGSIHVLQDGA